jgi:hypothetical protein
MHVAFDLFDGQSRCHFQIVRRLEVEPELRRIPEGETTVENVVLLCRAHNAHEAERYFGMAAVRPP